MKNAYDDKSINFFTKIKWFIYFTIYGKGHPDHINYHREIKH